MCPRDKAPRKVDDREFDEHEPQTASEKEPGNLLYRFSAPGREECAGSGQESERRCAVMRDESRDEKRSAAVSQILRSTARKGQKVRGMIQRYDDHGESTQ